MGPQGANYVSEAQRTVLAHTVLSVDTSNIGSDGECWAAVPQSLYQKILCGSSLNLSVLPHCPLQATATFVKEERPLLQ